jgi:competence protein ComEC
MNYLRYRGYKLWRFCLLSWQVPLFRVVLFIWLGILAAFVIELPKLLVAGSIAFILCLLYKRHSYLPLLLIFGSSFLRATYVINYIHNPQLGLVDTKAVAIEDGNPGDFNQQVVMQLAGAGYTVVTIPKYPQVFAGDVLHVKGELELPANTGSFDYVSYLQSQNVATVMRFAQTELVQTGTDLGTNLRKAITSVVKAQSLEPQSSLLTGLVIGKGGGFDAELKDQMQTAGVTHLVAVSGYNIGLIIVTVMLLAGFLHRKLLLVIAMLLVVLFLLVVGLGNMPALRAGIMAELTLLGLLLGRPGSVWRALTITLTLFLLQNPFSISDISLLLSVAALLGILLLNDRIQKVLPRLPGREVLSGTLSATIATYPLTAVNFGGFSAIGLVSNMLLVPIIGAVTLFGYVCLLLAVISETLAGIAFFYMNAWLKFVIQIIQFCASLPFAYTTDTRILRLVFLSLLILIIYADYNYVRKRLGPSRRQNSGNNQLAHLH